MNAPSDTLGSVLAASHMVGINMNEALDDSDIGPPVVSHISAGIGQSAAQNSKGFGIFIDEAARSEEHTSELQSLMRISYAVFCLKKKTERHNKTRQHTL